MSNIRSLFDNNDDDQQHPTDPNATSSFTGGEKSGLAVFNPPEPGQQPNNRFIVTVYRNGFQVNGGPFRDTSIEENAQALQDMRQGIAPPEIERAVAASGQNMREVQVMVNQKDEDYTGPTETEAPHQDNNGLFAGQGQTLGGGSSSGTKVETHAGTVVHLDESKPMATIQFRFPDGQRKVQKFNLDTHRVSDVAAFAASCIGADPSTVVLVAGFPPKPVADLSLTVRDAGHSNDNHQSNKRTVQLPDSQDECLGVGIKIIQNAYMSKVQALEHEVRALRLSLDQEKAAHMQTQKRCNALDVDLIDMRQTAKKMQEENRNLVQNLRSQNQQLEHYERLKQTLVGSLDSFQSESSRLGNEGDSGYTDPRFLRQESYLQGIAPMAASDAPPPMCTTPVGSASMYGGFTGASNNNQHHQYNFGGNSSNFHNSSSSQGIIPPHSKTSPVNNSNASISGIGMLNNNNKNEDSAMADVSGDSAGGRGIDGKSFFKVARSRLSYETFNKFLASIKRLNAQEQSIDATLSDVKKIFDEDGTDNDDLYSDFASLINKRN
ncbi:hypothetical protein FOL47_006232 [Perkinsus chesapeaki]|uniref:Uncharacterized protein n=1 Tax=Perkinsus chesapeaki TaxID=330153 RepID=A0A7J6LT13_PERCH|nr:hypothetical protein FOL47_006232 [Perkinsus chesapeaki]